MEDEAMKEATQISNAERVLIRALASASGAQDSAREGTDEDDPAMQARCALQSERLHVGLASQSLIEALLEAGNEADILSVPKTEEDRRLLASILHDETVEGAVRALRSIHWESVTIPFAVTDSRTNEIMWLRKTNCKHCNCTLEIVEVDPETGDYTHQNGEVGNVQADGAEDQRNEKRKRLGLTYWGMEDECTREEIAERVKATQALPDDCAFGK